MKKIDFILAGILVSLFFLLYYTIPPTLPIDRILASTILSLAFIYIVAFTCYISITGKNIITVSRPHSVYLSSFFYDGDYIFLIPWVKDAEEMWLALKNSYKLQQTNVEIKKYESITDLSLHQPLKAMIYLQSYRLKDMSLINWIPLGFRQFFKRECLNKRWLDTSLSTAVIIDKR